MVEGEAGLIKWIVEIVLGGATAAVGWWVNHVQTEHRDLRDKQEADVKELRERQTADATDLHDRITRHQQQSADTYARRDDVREGFARIEQELDQLVEHAMHGGGKG